MASVTGKEAVGVAGRVATSVDVRLGRIAGVDVGTSEVTRAWAVDGDGMRVELGMAGTDIVGNRTEDSAVKVA
jgi:hypothetical protein